MVVDSEDVGLGVSDFSPGFDVADLDQLLYCFFNCFVGEVRRLHQHGDRLLHLSHEEALV